MGKFQSGTSGNPQGRPKGTGHAHLRAQIAEALPEVLQTLIAAAKEGDTRAAKLLLERVMPPLKPEEAPLSLQSAEALDIRGAEEAGFRVLGALLAGDIPTVQAACIITTLTAHAKGLEASVGRAALGTEIQVSWVA